MSISRKGFTAIEVLVLATVTIIIALSRQESFLDTINPLKDKNEIRNDLQTQELTLSKLNQVLSKNNYKTLSGENLSISQNNPQTTTLDCQPNGCYEIEPPNSLEYFSTLGYEATWTGNDNKIIQLTNNYLSGITTIQELSFNESASQDWNPNQDYLNYYNLEQVNEEIFNTNNPYASNFSSDYETPQSIQTGNSIDNVLTGNTLYKLENCNQTEKPTTSTGNNIAIVGYPQSTFENCNLEIDNENIIIDNIAFKNSDLTIKNTKNVILNNLSLLSGSTLHLSGVNYLTIRKDYIDETSQIQIENSRLIQK